METGVISIHLVLAEMVPAPPASLQLQPPDTPRGLPLMAALSVCTSASEWYDRELSWQDVSDLLWAANGISRAAEQKCTASSAMNAQDIDVYVFMKDGVYLDDAQNHELKRVIIGDYRVQILMRRPTMRWVTNVLPFPLGATTKSYQSSPRLSSQVE